MAKDTKPKPKSKPAKKPDPKAKPKTAAKPAPKAKPKASPKPAAKPAPKAKAAAKPKSKPVKLVPLGTGVPAGGVVVGTAPAGDLFALVRSVADAWRADMGRRWEEGIETHPTAVHVCEAYLAGAAIPTQKARPMLEELQKWLTRSAEEKCHGTHVVPATGPVEVRDDPEAGLSGGGFAVATSAGETVTYTQPSSTGETLTDLLHPPEPAAPTESVLDQFDAVQPAPEDAPEGNPLIDVLFPDDPAPAGVAAAAPCVPVPAIDPPHPFDPADEEEEGEEDSGLENDPRILSSGYLDDDDRPDDPANADGMADYEPTREELEAEEAAIRAEEEAAARGE